MSIANGSLSFLILLTAFFMAGGSLCARRSLGDDGPLALIDSSFFNDQPQPHNVTATASQAPNFQTLRGSPEVPFLDVPQYIPASFVNGYDDQPPLFVSENVSYQETIPEPILTPMQSIGAEPHPQDLATFDEEVGTSSFSSGYGFDPPPTPLEKRSSWNVRRPFRSFLRRRLQSDYGLGYERLAYSPMVLDTPLTSPYMGIRIRADRGMNAPDRLEYLWGKAGSGPAPESRVDLIDTIFRTELGHDKAGFISEMRMRSLDPTINGNTVGFGDMLVGGKVLVYDSGCTKVSTIFLTHLNTGPEKKGLGRGHVALEPGLLAMRKWSERTYLFGEWKYHVPLGATPGFAGDVFRTGWGVATIWHDSDRYAILPTFEIQTHSFLFGGRTRPDGTEVRIDGATSIDLYPGIRWTFSETALGACEVGMAGGVSFADRDWFDSRMMIEVRWLR